MTLSITMLYHCAECHILFIVMLDVVMLSINMLNVIMLSVDMLNVIMPSVVAFVWPRAQGLECSVNKEFQIENHSLIPRKTKENILSSSLKCKYIKNT